MARMFENLHFLSSVLFIAVVILTLLNTVRVPFNQPTNFIALQKKCKKKPKTCVDVKQINKCVCLPACLPACLSICRNKHFPDGKNVRPRALIANWFEFVLLSII